LLDIVSILNNKTGRLEISTNGFLNERLVVVSEKFPNVTFRISAENKKDACKIATSFYYKLKMFNHTVINLIMKVEYFLIS